MSNPRQQLPPNSSRKRQIYLMPLLASRRQRSPSPLPKRRKLSSSSALLDKVVVHDDLESNKKDDSIIDPQELTDTAIENNAESHEANTAMVGVQLLDDSTVEENPEIEKQNDTATELEHLTDIGFGNNIEDEEVNGDMIESELLRGMGSPGTAKQQESTPAAPTQSGHYLSCDWKALRSKTFQQVNKRLDKELKDPTSSLALKLNINSVQKDKWDLKTASKTAGRQKASNRPKNAKEVMSYLVGEEEKVHSWSGSKTAIPKYVQTDFKSPFTSSPEGLLMRVYDGESKAKIKSIKGGLISQASVCRLKTAKEREVALQNHADWGSRKASPFISTTTSPDEIANIRFHGLMKRAPVGEPIDIKFVLVNSYARLATEMPLLRMTAELEHYNVFTPYGNRKNYRNSFYENEYLLLFRATEDEIVRVWEWDEMVEWAEKKGYRCSDPDNDFGVKQWFGRWFKTVAIPEFNEHEKRRKLKKVETEKLMEERKKITSDPDKQVEQKEIDGKATDIAEAGQQGVDIRSE